MYPVSEEYKQGIYNTNGRKTVARVVFEVLDVDAFEDNSKNVTSEAIISRLEQVTNKKRAMSKKYATYEPDYIKLDGSFIVPPRLEQAPEAEMGWWSEILCEENGVFNPYQVLEFTFTKDHSSMGLTIVFDTAANEYAADFDIKVFNAADVLIHNEQVTDNTSPKYELMKQLDNYRKIEVIIKKWAKGLRRARVIEVDFGLVKEYDSKKLASLKYLKEIDLIGKTIPISELVFVVDNTKREFNIVNPEGFYRSLQKRQEVKVEMGVEIFPDTFDYIPIGLFYLTDWKSDEGSLTTTFIAQDVIQFLDSFEMENKIADLKSLYTLAEEILSAGGITNYEIDSTLQSINTQAIYKKMTARNLMRHICVAGRVVCFSNRNGGFVLKQLQETEPVDDITFHKAWEKPQITLDKLVALVEVNIYHNGEVDSVYQLQNGTEGEIYKVDNPLINDSTTAQAVAEWILSILNKRAMYDVNWIQNPALDVGDMLEIENAYGIAPARLYKQEIEYRGYTRGRSELRGAIEGD